MNSRGLAEVLDDRGTCGSMRFFSLYGFRFAWVSYRDRDGIGQSLSFHGLPGTHPEARRRMRIMCIMLNMVLFRFVLVCRWYLKTGDSDLKAVSMKIIGLPPFPNTTSHEPPPFPQT